MRRKIAKRKKKELVALGGFNIREKHISEPGWRKKDCGWSIKYKYCEPDGNVWEYTVLGKDLLECYKLALEEIYAEQTSVDFYRKVYEAFDILGERDKNDSI